MVQRYRRGGGKRPHGQKQQLLGNHQKCWIWGRNVVLEALSAGVWPIVEVQLSEQLAEGLLEETRARAEELGVPTVVAAPEQLTRVCHSSEHQGFVAKMPRFPYASADDVLGETRGGELFGILDSLQDPYNFGAVIRSAEVLGVDALFVATRNQVEVSSLVARASAGAVNRIPIVQAERLCELGSELRQRGLQLVAAVSGGEQGIEEFDFRPPTAIVIGNEGAGISAELLAVCDKTVRIPQSGRLDSLNAAVSAGILFYEASRQRRAE